MNVTGVQTCALPIYCAHLPDGPHEAVVRGEVHVLELDRAAGRAAADEHNAGGAAGLPGGLKQPKQPGGEPEATEIAGREVGLDAFRGEPALADDDAGVEHEIDRK